MRQLDDILAAAEVAGFNQTELARAAGLLPHHIARWRAGTHRPDAASLARLDQALARLRLGQIPAGEHERALNATYRAALALAALSLGCDPADAQASAPAARATASAEWTAAARARRLALYLLNAGLGFKITAIARVAGVTKQAVSLAVRDIEDARDDNGFDGVVARLTAALTGEA